MKYNVQYKIETDKESKQIEVSVENYEELVNWLNLFQKLQKANDVEFSLVEEDLDDCVFRQTFKYRDEKAALRNKYENSRGNCSSLYL